MAPPGLAEPAAALALPPLVAALAGLEHEGAGEDAQSPTLRALLSAALMGPLREFAGRPGKQIRARLVELMYGLAGGDPARMHPELPLLIEALHGGSLIIDDIEDGSTLRRGAPALHQICGTPLALNAGNFLYFFAMGLLARAGLPDADRLIAFERVSECLLRCHQGQALDLHARAPEIQQARLPEVVRAISALKTGSLLQLCAELAALNAGAGPEVRAAFGRFGREVGVGLQMFDDLSGVLNPRKRDKALEDLRLGRATWVLAFLALELPTERYLECQRELRALMAGADPNAVLEQLRLRSALVGRRQARKQLDDAFAGLRAVVADGPRLAALAAQLDELEAAYVSG